MKNTIKIISIISAAILCSATAFAQDDNSGETSSWYDNFTVGADSQGNGDASISFTSPGEGKDSYAVDIGVAYNVTGTKYWSIAPTIEYHRNTALEDEQDMISGGIEGSYRIGDVMTAEGVPSFAVMTDGSLSYKWDGISDDESWMPEVTFTPLYSPWGFGNSVSISDLLRIRPELSGGFVYEDGVSGEDGNTLRAKVNAGVVFFPQGFIKDNKLTFTLSNTYWNELTASGKFDDGKDDFNLLKIDATYYFHTKEKDGNNIGVTLTYQDGADPDHSLEDQSFVKLGFVFAL